MKRTLLLCSMLLALCGTAALLAAPAPPAPQTADLTQLRQAIFQPGPTAGLNPLDGALPMRTCVPTGDPCIDAQCNCAAQCSGSCGIGSFTCNESTGAYTCKCKGC